MSLSIFKNMISTGNPIISNLKPCQNLTAFCSAIQWRPKTPNDNSPQSSIPKNSQSTLNHGREKSRFKSLLSQNQILHCLLKTQNRPSLIILTKTLAYSFSPQIETETKIPITLNKPLLQFFKEAVGLSEKSEPHDDYPKHRLSALEREIRELKSEEKVEIVVKSKTKQQVKEKKIKERPKKTAAKRLSNLFLNKNSSGEKDNVRMIIEEEICKEVLPEPRVFKELSPEVEGFLRFLHNEGYFKNANFLPRSGKLDSDCFQDEYARDFVKFAAEEFGKDHKDMAKWLSGSDLKKVALFGCPSTARKAAFSAKRLRIYFEIPENKVCGKCVLKDSCKFVNQSVCKGDNENLNLATIMRVIILYATEEVPIKLLVPDDMKNSVNNLLRDIINLSQADPSSQAT